MTEPAKETWGSGNAYEQYVGRWSRPVAREFLPWLAIEPGRRWADVGCGTGVLADAIFAQCAPEAVAGIDRSASFVEVARREVTRPGASFEVGDALALPWEARSFDNSVSGLVLNFVPDSTQMVREMIRVTRAGGTVAAYVWDYAGGMRMMRHFWDTAIALNPRDRALDQAERFPLCEPHALEALFTPCGLGQVQSRPIDIPMRFADFDDFWRPFLGGQGTAPTYLARLDEASRNRIRDALRERLQPGADGAILMDARAWAVKGVVAG